MSGYNPDESQREQIRQLKMIVEQEKERAEIEKRRREAREKRRPHFAEHPQHIPW